MCGELIPVRYVVSLMVVITHAALASTFATAHHNTTSNMVSSPPSRAPAETMESLKEENRALKDENRELKAGLGSQQQVRIYCHSRYVT